MKHIDSQYLEVKCYDKIIILKLFLSRKCLNWNFRFYTFFNSKED